MVENHKNIRAPQNTMNSKTTHDEFGTTQSLSAHLLNLPPAKRYETAGARSTRMIIDAASYSTTPTDSPPSEISHVFSAHDAHRSAPDLAAQTEAGHVLDHQVDQSELGTYITSYGAQAEVPTHQVTGEMERAPSDRAWSRQHQGFISPYMLKAIANSEAAGPQARASAEQTLLSSKSATHSRVLKEDFAPTVPTAPAQRQLKDGRWEIGFKN